MSNISSADWVQRHMLPQTLQAGKLTAQEATRIRKELVSRYRNIARSLSSVGSKRQIVEVSYELRTELPGDYCPVCRPPVDAEITSPLVKPTRLVNRVVYILSPDKDELKMVSNLEFLAVAEAGEEPEFSQQCSEVSQNKVTSFSVEGKLFDLYLALSGRSENTLDIFLKSTRSAHKMIIYKTVKRLSVDECIDPYFLQKRQYKPDSSERS
ncbi:hypothetical protein KY349_03725 [Candidatus Woesearchaeota archaeon]|nr:hypothetical protein [Candidatus Woesearchaeota archaeon]